MELYPHQELAVQQLRNGCILWGGVGTGKSMTAAAYYMKAEAPKDVYVITTAKKRDSLDWEGDFTRLGVGKVSNATVAGVLTVDSWNNIGKYHDVKDAFFIFDEQRLVGSGTWTQSFIKIARANHWILLSATPGDTWLDYIPVFVANGFYKNRTEFKLEHVVYNHFAKFPKVDHYVQVSKLIKHRNSILVEMPYVRHTSRVDTVVPVSFDAELTDQVTKKRWNVYEERPLRDAGEMFSVMRKVANSDPDRLLGVRKLLDKHSKLIVFYNFDYELEILRCLKDLSISTELVSEHGVDTDSEKQNSEDESFHLKTGETKDLKENLASKMSLQDESLWDVQIAEWNGHKHQSIPDSQRWVYLVQYVAGAEGWNCIETDAMCFYSLTYSYKLFHQAHGRIDRLNTPFKKLYYYTLMSQAPIDLAVEKAIREKRSFNESLYLQQSRT